MGSDVFNQETDDEVSYKWDPETDDIAIDTANGRVYKAWLDGTSRDSF